MTELELILAAEALAAGNNKDLLARISELEAELELASGWQIKYTQLKLLFDNKGDKESAELTALRRKLKEETQAKELAQNEAREKQQKVTPLELKLELDMSVLRLPS